MLKLVKAKTVELNQSPCMPDSLNPHGAECWIAGLGRTENESQSSQLRSMTLNSFNREYCVNPNHR